MAAFLDYASADASNLGFITNGPLFNYGGRDPAIYKCPADRSVTQRVGNLRGTPRICSVSMSQTFGNGGWLPSPIWRTYVQDTQIGNPAKTWVFADEHPDSINDGGFAVRCDGAESMNGSGRIIDMPSSLHEGAGIFVFADGSADVHRWRGRTIRPPVTYGAKDLQLNIPAGDSQVDIVWLAARTTVRR